MNNKPLVSIITPLYNAEKYIKETIESVLNQTYENWEMIIIDDGSTDKSSSIVQKYVEKDKRITMIRKNKNSGVSDSRNTGMKKISSLSKYIAFLDSDDIWLKYKLEKQISLMEENEYLFSFTNYTIVNEAGENIKTIEVNKYSYNYTSALKGNPIACSTAVLNKNIIKSITFKCQKHEDYIFWLDTLEKNIIEAYLLNENLAMYRATRNSLSSNKLKAACWTWKIYRSRLSFMKSIYNYTFYIGKSILKYIF